MKSKRMPKDRLLHVLDVQEEMNGEIFYVAQCLEYDVRGIGSTVEEARAHFVRRIQSLKKHAELEGVVDPFQGLEPAPERFWDMLERFTDEGGTTEQPYW
jgi:hypothetical protein